MIKFDEWKKMDIRVGEIKEIKDHPNADKLYILKVDIGDKEIQVVTGLKEYYKKEKLKGKRFVFFVNLEPVNLRGENSEGMILAAVKDKKVVLLKPDKKIDNGARIE